MKTSNIYIYIYAVYGMMTCVVRPVVYADGGKTCIFNSILQCIMYYL